MSGAWLEELRWNADGLIAVIVQDHCSAEVLMLAWMNREALNRTVELGEAVYWSRSRQRLWHKGEQSGHIQKVHEIRADCDRDTLLLRVEQRGGIACHTGRRSCFSTRHEQTRWCTVEPVLRDPQDIYPS
ncbi:MAG: phosphoribosyl-AMP cyclohydrolase [Nitrococcus mobilis]|nr:phosphoribosyl-AMP cyclohydrolase [Nitrococcus mobilis]